MARGQRSGWRSTRRRRISYGACWPGVFRIYLPSVLRSSGSSPAPHSQVQLISQLIYLTIHLSSYLIIHLTTHLTTDLCCISLSVCLSIYLFFFFNTVHLSQLLCLLFYDCVSLTLLAYIFYLLVEPFFSTIFFRVFVSHKLLMVLYICLLIFRTSLMISLTVVKILVVYPRIMLGREGGGRLYDCQVWHHWHSLSQNQSHLDGCVPTIWRSLHGQQGAPFVFDPNTCVGDNRTHR